MDKNKFNREIGKKVWQSRIELGISRTDIASYIGVSHQQFEKYEKGLNRISVGTLAVIMEYLGIKPEYFFSDIEIDALSASQRRMCREISSNFLGIEDPNHRKLLMVASRILSGKDAEGKVKRRGRARVEK